MCMRRCWRIVYLAISAPKFSECAQCACAGVAAFFTWPFLHPNCQSVPNMNALVLLHFFTWSFVRPNSQSAPNVHALVLPHFLPGHFCAQVLGVHPMWMCWCCCTFYLVISAPKVSECAQCECAGVAAFFSWSFLCPNSQSVPNVNAPVLLHFLAGCFCAWILRGCPMWMPHFLHGHFCAQIVRVHPIFMSWCCHIF